MYWQMLTEDELLRYAEGSTEGQIEIARRVIAGTWRGSELEEAQQALEDETGKCNDLRNENTRLHHALQSIISEAKTAAES